MIRAFRNLIERQTLKARAEGKLSGLEGEGAPLPDRPEAAHVDAGLSAGMRMMAEAGAAPPEFPLKKQLDAARRTYATLIDPEEKRRAMAQIADLEMRYNLARDARRRFFR